MHVGLQSDTIRQAIKTHLRSQNESSADSASSLSGEHGASPSSASSFAAVNARSGGDGHFSGSGSGETFSSLSSDVLAKMAVESALQKGSNAVVTSGVQTPAEQKALDTITAQFQQRFADSAGNKEEFHALMKQSFGANYDQAKAENIRQQTLAGDFSWMPEIQLVDGAALTDVSGNQNGGVGMGAYSAEDDTIFLSRELLANDPSKAEEILTEEVGHAIDARINTSDAAGDEGNIFSILSHGGELTADELSELQTENDSGTIIVNGKEVEVEFGLFSGIKRAFKKIGRAFKKIGRAIKKGFQTLMASKLFNTILSIASFIPIPIIQVAVRVINVAKAAYMAYQGLKHGSISMVLGGIAGAAGGVANIGKMMGSTGNWVNTASRIASGAKQLSVAHQAISQRNFGAMAQLSTNFFGGDHAITNALEVAVKVDNVKTAFDQGINVNSVSLGASFLQDFTGDKGDAVLEDVKQTANTVGFIEQAVDDNRYGDAIGLFRTDIGATFNFSSGLQTSLADLEGGVRHVEDTVESYTEAVETYVDNVVDAVEQRFENVNRIPGATPGINPNAGFQPMR